MKGLSIFSFQQKDRDEWFHYRMSWLGDYTIFCSMAFVVLGLLSQYSYEIESKELEVLKDFYISRKRRCLFGPKIEVKYSILDYQIIDEEKAVDDWHTYAFLEVGQELTSERETSIEREFKFTDNFKIENEDTIQSRITNHEWIVVSNYDSPDCYILHRHSRRYSFHRQPGRKEPDREESEKLNPGKERSDKKIKWQKSKGQILHSCAGPAPLSVDFY